MENSIYISNACDIHFQISPELICAPAIYEVDHILSKTIILSLAILYRQQIFAFAFP